jgi:TonB family protein
MTAAALRPDLFTHLFATQRATRQKGDVAATGLSVLFHVGILTVLVWASTQITRSENVAEKEPVVVIPTFEPRSEPRENGSRGGGAATTLPRHELTVPKDIPGIIPDATPRQNSWFEPGPAPGPAATINPGSGGPGTELKDGFAVATTVPALLNTLAVQQALVRSYPAFLRDAGIGGEVMIWLLIDENGRVVQTEVKSSSGHPALDRAALSVGELMRFSPGRNRDQKVKVWVSLPVRFVTR